MVRSALALAATVVATAAAAPPASAQVGTAAIKITHCRVTPPRPLSHHPSGTEIAFTNVGPTLVHRITFTVGYRTPDGNLTRSVDDAGTFAPDTPVTHHYDLYRDVIFDGTAVTQCAVTAVR